VYAPKLGTPALRVWLHQVLPGLRLGKALAEDGQRACLARFTLYGEDVELSETGGEDPDDRLLHRVGNIVREALGLPTEVDRKKQLSAERDIIAAAASGHAELAATLGRELVMRNAAAPRMLSGRTRLGQREIW